MDAGREGFALAMHSGYAVIADDPALRPEKALTVEAWVKLNRPGGPINKNDLICKNTVYMIRLAGTMAGVIGVDGKAHTFNGKRPVPTGRWVHLAITYDSATRTAITYIDGTLDGKLKIPGDGPGLLTQRKSELRLGLNDWRPLGSEVDGKIAALRISNVARAFEPIPQPPHEATTAKGNLVPNGDFELGLLGWRMIGEGDANLVWATDTHDPASGRLCLHNIPGSAGGSALLSRPIPVNAGGHYVLSARVRADAMKNPRIEVLAGGAGECLTTVSPFPIQPAVDAKWTEVKQSFVLPDEFAAPSVCVSLPYPSSGELWVDDVRLMVDEPSNGLMLKDKIGVGPQNLPVGNLYSYTPGGTTPLALDIVNADTAAHKVAVRAIATDWEGQPRPAAAVGTFEVPAGGVTKATFGLNTGRRGAFRLAFELTSEGQTWRQGAECKYAVVVPLKGVGNAEDSMFGINTHMEREPTPHLARSMEVLSQCGVKWIRGWWGWGMCEKEQGKYEWTEFDRQLAAVEGAGLRLMPCLNRYYPRFEQPWAGSLSTPHQPPFPSMMGQWGTFCGKVAQHFAGKISAYEIWNEPTVANNGAITPSIYAQMLKEAAPKIRQYDSRATIVGFAGVPAAFMESVLSLDTAPTMDVVSEHSYTQLELPECNLPRQMKEFRDILAAHGGEKPLWHTEQGLWGDDDGYLPPAISEGDVAALHIRNFVVARSLGIEKYFWFSAQTTPIYGFAVYYENYIPRPRLAALAACASFLEGSKCQESHRPSENAYAYLFEGAQPVCVVWNMNAPARLTLPIAPDALQAFDMMGNSLPVAAEKDGAAVEIAAERRPSCAAAAEMRGC